VAKFRQAQGGPANFFERPGMFKRDERSQEAVLPHVSERAAQFRLEDDHEDEDTEGAERGKQVGQALKLKPIGKKSDRGQQGESDNDLGGASAFGQAEDLIDDG